MSAIYNFSLDRPRAVILAACFVAAAILLFLAGSISGVLYSGSRNAAVRVPEPPAVAKSKPIASPALASTSAAPPAAAASQVASESAQPSAPAAVASSSTPSLAPPAATAASPKPPESAPSTAPAATSEATTASSASAGASARTKPSQVATVAAPRPVEASYAIPLAVKVGSFAVKENAEGLMQSLKDMGYHPVMSLASDPRGHQWYVVKLGPYTRWNAASRVAARVSIAENVTPVIGPMQ